MPTCPERSVWERFTLGQLEEPDAQTLIEHLSNCVTCCETTERLQIADPLVAALQHGPDRIPRDEPDMRPLMERLQLLATLPILEEQDSATPRTITAVLQEYQSLLSPPQSPDELGRLADRYRLLEVLGQGGMGVVFLADDLQLRRRVSLKIVKPSLANSPKANERFLFEASVLGRLDHPHIVAIYEANHIAGVPYLTMPRLHGETLRQRLRRESRLPLPEALRIAREIATGLTEAHRHGLLHRDIKPENIFLESLVEQAARLLPSDPSAGEHVEPQRQASRLPPQEDHKFSHVKLLDFGIARAFGLAREAEHRASFTQSGAVIGTPEYMAPEQSRADEVDHRADLFSLGCVLSEMLTGASPFHRAIPRTA